MYLPSFDKVPLTCPETGGPIPVRTANGVLQRNRQGVIKRAARNYRVTDPRLIAQRLSDSGFEVSQCVRLRSAWRFGLEVKYPEGRFSPRLGEVHQDYAKILCGNTGRESLQIAPGTIRLACMNQFTADVIRLHHTDPEIERFLTDPAQTLFDLRDYCRKAVETLDTMRGVVLPLEYATVVENAPRLWARFVPALRDYRRQGWHVGDRSGVDAWELLQALTQIKAPRTVKAASVLLRHHGDLLGGHRVEEYFNLFAPKAPVTLS